LGYLNNILQAAGFFNLLAFKF